MAQPIQNKKRVLDSSRSTRPPFRQLRVFTIDPSLNNKLDTAIINQVTLQVPWEDLSKGPVGEYLEVVDIDPPSRVCYPPVDLEQPGVLAQDGLPPAEGDPQFHQQMVYGLAMTTIRNFEEALGRPALWAPRIYRDEDGDLTSEFVQRLRVYPHGLRQANAFYSPSKKALLFGYFPASTTTFGSNLPGGIVFTCLSHDIIAHETTHALLDGLHRRFLEPSNRDVLAFHEAFADIVALFQHFSFPDVLRHQIARTRGDLSSENLLAQLAQQFGQATGRYSGLRDFIGGFNEKTNRWERTAPDPKKLQSLTEPHDRGAVLVAAVFDAFLTIYGFRTADLLRIATGGSGVLPPGDLHPDLVGRLAMEAARSAHHILRVCIRALDYCPPVDITFGDYLRALVTADADVAPDDRLNYRTSIIEAFRQRGIYPTDVRNLSEESLQWRPPQEVDQELFQRMIRKLQKLHGAQLMEGATASRESIFNNSRHNQASLHEWLLQKHGHQVMKAMGLAIGEDAPQTIRRSAKGHPVFEVHSVRPAYRIKQSGQTMTDLVVEITQQRAGYLDPDVQARADRGEPNLPKRDFVFRGGSTLLVDLARGEVRYAIGKGILSERRLREQRKFLRTPMSPSLQLTYFGDPRRAYFENLERGGLAEPFAFLHSVPDVEEV